MFDNERFRCLAEPSNGHLHNLRRSPAHVREMGGRYGRCPARLMIAELRRPPPEGLLDCLRVDSVHPVRARFHSTLNSGTTAAPIPANHLLE